VNWLEQISKGQKHKTMFIKYIKYILFMSSKQRYPMRSLVVEIQGARRATCEKFEIPLNRSEKVITQNDMHKIHSMDQPKNLTQCTCTYLISNELQILILNHSCCDRLCFISSTSGHDLPFGECNKLDWGGDYSGPVKGQSLN
jgi:hypothetical protein